MTGIESYILSRCADAVPSREKGIHPAYTFTCPVCRKKGHAQIRVQSGKWTCYKCQAGGDFTALVATTERCTKQKAQDLVKSNSLTGGTFGNISYLDALTTSAAEAPPEEFVTCPLPPDFQLISHHPYLAERWVSPEETQHHFFGVAESGQYKGRIVIPIFEYGAVVGFVARDYTKKSKQKILNPPISTSAMVWNIDAAKQYSTIIVCEGVFSALRVGYDAVAVFGKNFSRQQMQKLADFGTKSIVLLFDADVNVDSTHLYLKQDDGTTKRVLNPMPGKLARLASMFDLRIARLRQGDPGDEHRSVLRMIIDHAPRHQRDLSVVVPF